MANDNSANDSSEAHDLLVKFQELQNASDAYKAEGGAVKQALAAFEAAANLQPSAFGNLPESSQLVQQYAKFYKQVVGDMTTLSKALPDGAASLAASAIVYHNAEKKLEQQIAEINKIDKLPG
jgi:uncharacterized protein YukE